MSQDVTESRSSHGSLSSQELRELMQRYPFDDDDIQWRSKIEIGKNTALLKVVGPVVYARKTTAHWMWSEMREAMMWHEFGSDLVHRVAFEATYLPTVVRTMQFCGKQVLIV